MKSLKLVKDVAALSFVLLSACSAVDSGVAKPHFDWSGEYTNLDPAEQMKQYGVSDDEYDGIRITPYQGNAQEDLKELTKEVDKLFKGIEKMPALQDDVFIDKNPQLSQWIVEINSYQTNRTDRFPMLAYPAEWYKQIPEMNAAYLGGQYECMYSAYMDICPQVVKSGGGYKVNPNIIELRGFMSYHNYERHPLGGGAIDAAREKSGW